MTTDQKPPETIAPTVATLAQLPKLLGVSKTTVYRLVGEGKIKTVDVSPGRRVVLLAEITRYLATGYAGSGAPADEVA